MMDRRAIGCVFLCIAAFLWMGEHMMIDYILVNVPGIGTLGNIPTNTIIAIVCAVVGLIYLVIGEITAVNARR